jgi:hypothetical protein
MQPPHGNLVLCHRRIERRRLTPMLDVAVISSHIGQDEQ